jgi:integrase
MTRTEAVSKFRAFIRLKHFSRSTEQSYCYYFEKFCVHSESLPPNLPTEKRIESFLGGFAGASASSQNVAFNAVLCFYRNVLGVEPKGINALRARRPVHHRNAPAPADTRAILNFIAGHEEAQVSLVCDLIYGVGARVSEPLNLRIRDVQFEPAPGHLILRQAKQHKDRVVPMPDALFHRLVAQMEYAHSIWKREGDRWPVKLPGLLHVKYPHAQFDWAWFWLFPARGACQDERTGLMVRWRLHEANIRRAMRRACLALKLSVLPHELRHGYATDCLNAGVNPRALQREMGHSSLETTMGYCHAEPLSVRSPLDRPNATPPAAQFAEKSRGGVSAERAGARVYHVETSVHLSGKICEPLDRDPLLENKEISCSRVIEGGTRAYLLQKLKRLPRIEAEVLRPQNEQQQRMHRLFWELEQKDPRWLEATVAELVERTDVGNKASWLNTAMTSHPKIKRGPQP